MTPEEINQNKEKSRLKKMKSKSFLDKIFEEVKVPSIQELRSKGWSARVVHWRRLDISSIPSTIAVRKDRLTDISSFAVALSANGLKKTDFTFNSCGGKTVVELRAPNGEKVWGLAECSSKDAFCYKAGVLIATKKALENFRGVV